MQKCKVIFVKSLQHKINVYTQRISGRHRCPVCTHQKMWEMYRKRLEKNIPSYQQLVDMVVSYELKIFFLLFAFSIYTVVVCTYFKF